ncbi:MAG: hypothetical protein FWD87_10095, partial [Spirochaetaceae bacterium]|nr:hypothetical protein [Spirochaetaceae bacterium]
EASRNSGAESSTETILRQNSSVQKDNRPEQAGEREKLKQEKREKRKLEKRAEEIMSLVDDLEQKAKHIEEMMGKVEFYSDGQKIKELKESLQQNRASQAELLNEWENVEATIKAL